jgi:hypothetical protein
MILAEKSHDVRLMSRRSTMRQVAAARGEGRVDFNMKFELALRRRTDGRSSPPRLAEAVGTFRSVALQAPPWDAKLTGMFGGKKTGQTIRLGG